MPPRRTVTRVPEETVNEVAEKAAAERIAKGAMATFAGDVDLEKSEVMPVGLYQKMAHIMANMPDMQPEGKNAHFTYKFWQTDQITGYFRSIFGKLGLAFLVDVEGYEIVEHATGKGGRSANTNLHVRFTLVDIDTGEQCSGRMVGQGDDPGDKGANKAIAAATKYWLLKTFLLGGIDAEADEDTDRRTSGEREERQVRIGKSKIEGIGRGGRANKATDVQIRQIAELAKDLNWNALGAARRISEWVGDDLDLSDTPPEEHREALRRYLDGLSADDAAKVLNNMVELRDAAEEPEKDTSDDAYADYG